MGHREVITPMMMNVLLQNGQAIHLGYVGYWYSPVIRVGDKVFRQQRFWSNRQVESGDFVSVTNPKTVLRILVQSSEQV